jgi:hypothetical protein
MTRLTVNFPDPGPVQLTSAPGFALTFPAPQAVTLQVQGIQGGSGGGGGGATDLGYVAATRTLTSSTGDDVVLPLADGTNAGLMSSASVLALASALQPGALIPWTDVTGRPSTFPPSAHTHVAADVTDFATATRAVPLTGYAAAGSRIALAATDTILGAFNKLGKWVADLAAVAFSGSASDLTAGTLPAARFDDTAHGTRAGGTLHPAATTSVAGFMSGADKTKLDGVATGATANATDAALRDRATHTGTQLASTISDFTTAVAATPAVTANTAKVTNATHTGDASGATVLTLATVNANVGTFGLAGSVAQFTVNAKGLITSAVNVAISVAATAISDSTAAGRAMLTAATAAAQTALLTVFSPSGPGSAKGLVPDPGTTAGTTRYLREDGTWVTPPGGGGGSPGGATGEVQFNNAGAFAGAADVEIEGGQLRLPAIVPPTAPAAGGLKMFARNVGGRILPATMGPSGLDSPLQPHLGLNKVYWLAAQGNSTVLSSFAAGGITAFGTPTAKNWAATSLYTVKRGIEYLVTVAATTAIAGFRGAAQQFSIGGTAAELGGFHYICRWGPATGVATATNRAFVGFWASTAAATDVEPSSRTNQVGMGWDAADANISFIHNDGSGVSTKIDLGASFPVPTVDRQEVYELAMFSPPGTSQTVTYRIRNLRTGAEASGQVTTDLPSTSTGLNPYAHISVGGTSSVIGFCLFGLYIETDY